MTKAVPTLTLNGYITDVNVMLVKLFEYFVTSDYSQTVSYYEKISSLEYIIRTNGSDFDKLKYDIENTLRTMCGRYWDDIKVVVDIDETFINNNKVNYNLFIEITVTEDKKNFYLTKNLSIKESKIIGLNNIIDYFYS